MDVRTKNNQNWGLLFVVGIAIVAIASVVTALYQINKGPIAPSAPQSLPRAAEAGTLSCVKRAFADEFDNTPGDYHFRNEIQKIKAGDIVVWNFDIENTGTESTTINLSDVFGVQTVGTFDFLDSNCPQGSFDSNTMTLTCPNKFVGTGQNQQVSFRIKVHTDTPLGTQVSNASTVTDEQNPQNTATCNGSVLVAEATEQLPCNAVCESDKECDGNLTCVDDGGIFVCRDPNDPSDETCGAPTPTPTATGTLSPTPTVSNTLTPSATATPTNTLTLTPSPSLTTTATLTLTPTATLTGVITNTPTHTPTITPYADLGLTKVVNNTSPSINQQITYTIALKNYGPYTANNVTVREAIPAGTTYISSSVTRGSYDATSGIWTVGSIAPNETLYLYLTVRIDSTGTIVNVAEVKTSDLPDPNSTPDNNVTGENDQDDVALNSNKALASCDQGCTYNSDCADSASICYTTSSGNRCRLATNPTNSSCSASNSPTVTYIQPQLPKAGNENQGAFIIASVVVITIILFAVGLILLI